MKKYISILILSTLFFPGCEKIDKDASDCIRDKVREFAKHKICESGSSVSQYLFKDGNVYVFAEGNCGADLGADVYSESCEKIGYLGGFAGNMTIQGVIFYEEAVFIKTIWED
jgi:hypothetical protein